MLHIESRAYVEGIRGEQIVDFMLHCTDDTYRQWWPGTHFSLHTVESRPGHIGDVVFMDEMIGRRRLTMHAAVTELIPGRRIIWQFKQIVLLPAWLCLDLVDDGAGVMVIHTVRAGFNGAGKLLDPLLKLYFTDGFVQALDEHVRIEFPKLGVMLGDQGA